MRLYIDGYNGGDNNWRSVSVYDFQIYENEDPFSTVVLPDENYSLEGTATASDYETDHGDHRGQR